jgi:hypothetical protein
MAEFTIAEKYDRSHRAMDLQAETTSTLTSL